MYNNMHLLIVVGVKHSHHELLDILELVGRVLYIRCTYSTCIYIEQHIHMYIHTCLSIYVCIGVVHIIYGEHTCTNSGDY